jgi:hypothetical protein
MMRTILFTSLMTLLVASPLLAADAAKTPGKPADKSVKFPAPIVNEILERWNGVAWGTSLDAFKAKFPKAARGAGGRWTTGAGEEKLAGIAGNVLYGFNKKGELNLISFEPVESERTTLRDKLVDAGVMREGTNANWQSSGVSFICVDSKVGQLVVIINAKFADPKEKKT